MALQNVVMVIVAMLAPRRWPDEVQFGPASSCGGDHIECSTVGRSLSRCPATYDTAMVSGKRKWHFKMSLWSLWRCLHLVGGLMRSNLGRPQAVDLAISCLASSVWVRFVSELSIIWVWYIGSANGTSQRFVIHIGDATTS